LNIKNARFKASCQVDKDAITLSLMELALDYPLAPSAVWYELKEMMKKTIERPINLIRGGKTPEQN